MPEGRIEPIAYSGVLSAEFAKAVLERALAGEMTGHLGYDKHDPAGRGSGNNRNGTTGKTVLTDVGAVDLAVPGPASSLTCRKDAIDTRVPDALGFVW